MVASHSAMLLGTLNSMTANYWPVITQILSVSQLILISIDLKSVSQVPIDALPIASTVDIAALMGPPISDRFQNKFCNNFVIIFSDLSK